MLSVPGDRRSRLHVSVTQSSDSHGLYIFEGAFAIGWQKMSSRGGRLYAPKPEAPRSTTREGYTIRLTGDRVPTGFSRDRPSILGIQFRDHTSVDGGYKLTCQCFRMPGGILVLLTLVPILLPAWRRYSQRTARGFEVSITNKPAT